MTAKKKTKTIEIINIYLFRRDFRQNPRIFSQFFAVRKQRNIIRNILAFLSSLMFIFLIIDKTVFNIG